MDKPMKSVRGTKRFRAEKIGRSNDRSGTDRDESAGSEIVDFPVGAPVPDEIGSAQAKDRISDLVKKAAAGGRTTVISRGYAIAIIGPFADIPAVDQRTAVRLPTTEIKSGQTSIKGIVARDDFAILTIYGEPRAAVYRPKARRHPAQTEDKLDRLLELLETTKTVERQNTDVLERSAHLMSLVEELEKEIERRLDLLEKIDREQALSWRAQYATLTKRHSPQED
jgi:antitoxin (DNA-binding transcriptional repressor) of toxin-antitoxin stability system